MRENYYAVLGVHRAAADLEIKRAYHKLVRACHPDLHPELTDAEERLTHLNEAYHVLHHHDSRRAYDAMIFAALASQTTRRGGVHIPNSVLARRRGGLGPLVAMCAVALAILYIGAACKEPVRAPYEWRHRSWAPEGTVASYVSPSSTELEEAYKQTAAYWQREMETRPQAPLPRYNLTATYLKLAELACQRGDDELASGYRKASRDIVSDLVVTPIDPQFAKS